MSMCLSLPWVLEKKKIKNTGPGQWEEMNKGLSNKVRDQGNSYRANIFMREKIIRKTHINIGPLRGAQPLPTTTDPTGNLFV